MESFASSLPAILLPLVAVEEVDTRHPVGFSNVTLVRLLQSENAPFPMLVTELGIVTLVRLLQL